MVVCVGGGVDGDLCHRYISISVMIYLGCVTLCFFHFLCVAIIVSVFHKVHYT